MVTLRNIVTALLLLCASASYAANPGPQDGSPRTVEVYLEGRDAYRFGDELFSMKDLSRKLRESHGEARISRINLISNSADTSTAEDAFKVVSLAKELGAAAFFEDEGVFKPLEVQIVR